jgi:hypothetical protein
MTAAFEILPGVAALLGFAGGLLTAVVLYFSARRP